jgi:hypothetical protein
MVFTKGIGARFLRAGQHCFHCDPRGLTLRTYVTLNCTESRQPLAYYPFFSLLRKYSSLASPRSVTMYAKFPRPEFGRRNSSPCFCSRAR